MSFISDKIIPLEFHCKLYTSGFHESENMVNIRTINTILVNIDIISGSYDNGSTQPTIYSFFPNVSSGYKNNRKCSSSFLPSNNFRRDSYHHSLVNRSARKRA